MVAFFSCLLLRFFGKDLLLRRFSLELMPVYCPLSPTYFFTLSCSKQLF